MIEERKQDRFQQVLIDQLMVLQQKVNQWWLYTLSDFKQPNKTPHNFLSNSNFIYNFRCTQLYVRKQTIHQGKENSDTSSYRTKNYRGSKVLQAKSVSKNKRLLIFFFMWCLNSLQFTATMDGLFKQCYCCFRETHNHYNRGENYSIITIHL